MKIMILAGGKGSRLWPFSTEECPKQFLRFGQQESLLQKTVQRFVKKGLSAEIFIVTQQQYVSFVRSDLEDVLPYLDDQMIIEPDRKNTAPALTWGMRTLLSLGKATSKDLILMIPIDHHFSDEEAFMEKVWQAKSYAEKGCIVSFGVPCRRAETGYGYIQMLEFLGDSCCQVGRFVEKPAQDIAEGFLKSGRWLWNIGIYLFSIETYLKEMSIYAPQLARLLYEEDKLIDFYEQLIPISIDKALMEHSKNLCVMQLTESFWCDVGSWESVYSLLEKDEQGVVKLDKMMKAWTLANQQSREVINHADLMITELEEAILIERAPLLKS